MEEQNQKLVAQRAEIESSFWGRIIFMLDWLEGDIGGDVPESIDRTVAETTRDGWAQLAQNEVSNTIDDLIRLLWEPLREKGFEFTIEETDEGMQMHCTKCPYAEIAMKTGKTEWTYCLFCASDPHIVAGFNSQIGFRRTKTLVEGADCCDHFYYMKAAE